MKRLITNVLTFIIVINLSLKAFTQNDSEFYKRFEGTISDNIKVTANLVRIFDNVSGNYIYYFIDENKKMFYGKTIELNGTLSKDDSLKLQEFGSEKFTFEGLLADDLFSGIWKSTDNSKLNFEMSEYYPKSSMSLDVIYISSEEKLKKEDKNSPLARLELSLLYPDGSYFRPAITDSVRKIITNSFIGKGIKGVDIDDKLNNFQKEYYDNYSQQALNWEESGRGMSFNWEKQINMSVIYNSNYILCTEYLKYAYAGGAHGMSHLSYDIIDLKSGKNLNYNDIFIPASDSMLSIILTKQIRKNYEIPNEVKLSEAGFFVETIKPIDNIFINSEGIGFVYNSYQIAPYSRGTTTVLIDYKQIKSLLRDNTTVYRIAMRERED